MAWTHPWLRVRLNVFVATYLYSQLMLPSQDEPTRRDFLKAASAAVSGAALGVMPAPAAASAPRASRVRLGIASYSLRYFPRPQAIAMLRTLGASYVNIKSNHLAYDASPQEFADARDALASANLQVVGGGTITFDDDTDAGVNRYFAYARSAGMPLIVAACAPAVLPRIERYAKQYDIKIAIHNHGPEDKFYPSPYDVLKHVRGMDARMGLCIDVGHTVRTGTDVVAAIRDAGSRLHDLHLKDLRDLRDVKSQCVVGEGAIPIVDILQQLSNMHFAGCANLEYEIDEQNPLSGMQRSMAYLRGALAGIDASTKRK